MSFIQALIGSISNAGGGAPLDYSQSGGNVETSGAYTYITWTASGSFTLNTAADRDVEWCMIAGGGSAARWGGGVAQAGGGGGAGGRLTGTYASMPAETWTVTIGAGSTAPTGTSPAWMWGADGSNTEVVTSGSGDDFRCNGGGGGMSYLWPGASPYAYSGWPGGCGGGSGSVYGQFIPGGAQQSYPSPPNPTWVTETGNAGGTAAYNSSGAACAGGGGGIGSAGGNGSNVSPWNFYASPIYAGDGGAGAYHAMTNASSYVPATTGGGGGGGGGNNYSGVGGQAGSGGGTACSHTSGVGSSSATANTGSGSGSGHENSTSGNGGSGYVIARWVTLV